MYNSREDDDDDIEMCKGLIILYRAIVTIENESCRICDTSIQLCKCDNDDEHQLDALVTFANTENANAFLKIFRKLFQNDIAYNNHGVWQQLSYTSTRIVFKVTNVTKLSYIYDGLTKSYTVWMTPILYDLLSKENDLNLITELRLNSDNEF